MRPVGAKWFQADEQTDKHDAGWQSLYAILRKRLMNNDSLCNSTNCSVFVIEKQCLVCGYELELKK